MALQELGMLRWVVAPVGISPSLHHSVMSTMSLRRSQHPTAGITEEDTLLLSLAPKDTQQQNQASNKYKGISKLNCSLRKKGKEARKEVYTVSLCQEP